MFLAIPKSKRTPDEKTSSLPKYQQSLPALPRPKFFASPRTPNLGCGIRLLFRVIIPSGWAAVKELELDYHNSETIWEFPKSGARIWTPK